MEKILVIDDDTDICMLLNRYLTKNGYEVEEAYNGQRGLEALKAGKHDLVLCDFRLPDIDGLDALKSIKATHPQTQVIIITGYSDVKVAVKSVKMGAFEYVTKPIHPEEILLTIKKALKYKEADNVEPSPSKPKLTVKSDFEYVKGSSTRAKQLNNVVELVAPTDMTVVILGESGTGKEVIANQIHNKSKRKDAPFVAVDCGALPKELAGSELFGHVKGSFTGAVNDKKGHFEVASGGTLFLDEIGNLSYENQIKMLRALQERKVKKIGGTKDIPVDVRVIVATNEDLTKAVKEGRFREDLYYRINEFKVELPPLRERKTDMSDFAEYFLDASNQELQKEVKGLSDEVKEKFEDYYWHGNIRELRNVLKRAVLLAQDEYITLNDIPQEILNPSFIEGDFGDEENNNGEVTDLKSVAEAAEKKAILQVLKKTGYNKSKAADVLKVDRKTLYNKINAYGIEV